MKAEFKGRFRKPVTISPASLARLATSLESIRVERFRMFASEQEMSLKELEAIWRRENLIDVGDEPSLEATPAIVDAYYEKSRQRGAQERIADKLDELARVRVSVNFRSGTSYDFNELSQLERLLEDEPGTVDSISILEGDLLRNSFHLRFHDGRTTCSYSIEGTRSVVESAKSSLSGFLEGASPDHPYLHHRGLQGAVAVSLSTLTAYYLAWVAFGAASAATIAQVDWVRFALTNAITVVGVLVLTRLMERAFPKLQVEFGPHWRRIKSRRTVMLLVLTALLLPWLRELAW